MIQSAYDLSKSIQYKRLDYTNLGNDYTTLKNYTLKRFHDYLENAGYTWVESEKLKTSCTANDTKVESKLETYGVDLESLENKNANLSFENKTSSLRKEFVQSTEAFFKSGKLEQVLKQNPHKKEVNPLKKVQLAQKFTQEFYALPNQWKPFMDYMVTNHKVIVQATGKAYREGEYFKGREEEARYLFGKKTPCGALFQLIKDKQIKANEVVFLFDIDNTMIKDQSEIKVKRGTKAKHDNSNIETAKDTDAILWHLKKNEIPFGFLTFRDKNGNKGVEKTREDFKNAGITNYASDQFTTLKIDGAEQNIIFTNNKVKSFGVDKVLQNKNIKYVVMIDDSQAALREIKDSVEKGEATDLYTKTSANKIIGLQKPDWLNRIHTNSNGKKIILVNYAKEKEPDSQSIGVQTNQNNTAYFDRDQKEAFVLVNSKTNRKNYVKVETKNLLKEQEEEKNKFFTINTDPLNAQELPDEIEINDLKNIKTSSGGSNASFTGEINGKTYRVKMAQAYNAYNERLAAKLYKLAGCRVMDFTLVKIPEGAIQNNGTLTNKQNLTIPEDKFKFFTHPKDKTAFAASLKIDNLIDMRRFNSSTDINNLDEFVKNKIATLSELDRKEIFENFVIDAWLGNYDVIGTPGYGSAINIGFLKNGETYQPIRFDNGAALQSRAQGGKKGNGFNAQAKEFEFLLGVQTDDVKNTLALNQHRSIADASKAFFKCMTKEEFEAGQKKLKAITDNQIRQTVEKYGYEPDADEQDLKTKKALVELLIARKNVILSKKWSDVQNCLNKQ